ncbi:MAG: hypothetical protein V3T53_04920 [Phycisphaerales bacterium]
MKRRLFKLAVFLLLGAILNVAVAWGFALSVDLGVHKAFRIGARRIAVFHRDLEETDFDGWKLMRRAAPGGRVVAVVPEKATAPRDSADPDDVPADAASAYRRLCKYTDRPVNWPPGSWKSLVDQSRGWPMLAMCCQCEYNSYIPGTTFVVNGIEIDDGQTVIGEAIVLPLRPIWPGFAINTLFYAAILWSLTLGPFAARRRIRRKRGHCIKCGYDLRGAEHEACPECGAPAKRG